MRRNDREITDPNRIDEIIRACDCCRLGFADGETCYMVPLNFGFCREGETRVFYFHGASEGRKLDLARRLGRAAFEMDTGHQLRVGDKGCTCTLAFQSVMGEGTVEVLTDREEKRRGLLRIMEQNTGRGDWTFPDKAVDETAVLRLRVESISCKVHT